MSEVSGVDGWVDVDGIKVVGMVVGVSRLVSSQEGGQEAKDGWQGKPHDEESAVAEREGRIGRKHPEQS